MKEENREWKAGIIGTVGVVLTLFLIVLVSAPLSPNLPPLVEEELNTALYPVILLIVLPIGVIIGIIVVWRDS